MKVNGYKAFNPGLICNGKQYAENETFEESEAKLCVKGMHFCESPFDVLDYYPLVNDKGEFSEFATVVADGDIETHGNKSCTTKLHIGAKLSFSGFVDACVSFLIEKTKRSSGYCAQIGSSGYCAQIGSSGDCAKIGSSGNYAKIGSSGDCAQIGSSGRNCVICCAGHGSAAKAKIGSWITLSEWKSIDDKYIPVCVRTEQVDGSRIKEDTFYILKDGKFAEVL